MLIDAPVIRAIARIDIPSSISVRIWARLAGANLFINIRIQNYPYVVKHYVSLNYRVCVQPTCTSTDTAFGGFHVQEFNSVFVYNLETAHLEQAGPPRGSVFRSLMSRNTLS